MRHSWLGPALLSLVAALPSSASEWRWGEIPREELFATHFAECPDADAVTLLDHGVARLDAKNRLKLHRHVRTKILSDRGLDRAVVRVPLADGDEFKNFRGLTIVPPGHQIRLEKENVREEHDGMKRVMVISFPSVQKGAVLEWDYEIRTDRLHTLEPWRFQNRDFVRVSRFELQLPPGLAFDATFGWTPGLPPTPVKTAILDPEDPKRPLEQTAWELRDQAPPPPLALLPYPEEHRVTLYVQLKEFAGGYARLELRRSWESLGKAMAAETVRMLTDAAGVSEWAAQATTAASGTDALARALHQRVRDGLASDPADPNRAPKTPSEIVAAGHGSPSEKNLVLLQLLRANGMNADPVFICSRARGAFQPRLHAPEQLDHVLVRLDADGRGVWLDTSAHCPFGVLPPDYRVAKGLLARADAGSIVDVAAPAPETARTVSTAATLDASGTLDARSTIQLTGDRALLARRSLASAGARAYAESLVRARFGNAASVQTAEVQGANDAQAPLVLSVTYRVPAWARSEGESMSSEIPFLDAVTKNPLPRVERAYPAELPFLGVSREDVTLTFPENYALPVVPRESNVRSTDFTLKTTYAPAERALASTRDLRIREARIEDEDVPKLWEFFEGALAADAVEIRLQKRLMKSAAR